MPQINNKKTFIKNNEVKVGKNAEKYFGVKDIIIENFSNFDNPLLIASSLEYNESELLYCWCYFTKILDSKIVKISDWKISFNKKVFIS